MPEKLAIKPAINAPPESTRQTILLTALKLFHDEGIDAVKLLRISAESGSANTAAVHYYFKNKDGLVQAILDFLDANIWSPAYQQLEDVLVGEPDIREVLYVGLWPSNRIAFDFSWGADAQSVMFHIATGANSEYRHALDTITAPQQSLFRDAVRALVPELSDDVFEARWNFVLTGATFGLHASTRLLRLEEGWTLASEKKYVDYMLDYVVGGLTGPG
jgi:AcrR family transcriptional regulator